MLLVCESAHKYTFKRIIQTSPFELVGFQTVKVIASKLTVEYLEKSSRVASSQANTSLDSSRKRGVRLSDDHLA